MRLIKKWTKGVYKMLLKGGEILFICVKWSIEFKYGILK